MPGHGRRWRSWLVTNGRRRPKRRQVRRLPVWHMMRCSMSCVRIGVYRVRPDVIESAVRTIESGLVPLNEREEGFVSFQLAQTDDDELISINVWQTERAADAAGQRSADWVRQNL